MQVIRKIHKRIFTYRYDVHQSIHKNHDSIDATWGSITDYHNYKIGKLSSYGCVWHSLQEDNRRQ